MLFCAVPNGGLRSRTAAASLRASGVVRGVPDLLIFDPPPAGGVGTALELKRAGGRPSDVRPEQRAWLAALEARGWASLIGYGAEDALDKLRALGYRV